MKYKMKTVKEDTFKSFEITLTFETKEEYVHFHDKVMSFLTNTTIHPFHGDVYKMGSGVINEAEGNI